MPASVVVSIVVLCALLTIGLVYLFGAMRKDKYLREEVFVIAIMLFVAFLVAIPITVVANYLASSSAIDAVAPTGMVCERPNGNY